MRLEKYITEGSLDQKTFDKFMSEVSQYREEMKGVKLWRATNANIKGFEKIIPRKNRKPKDTPQEVHEWFDAMFKKYHGWKARSEGVFASSIPTGIEQFGKNTYIVMPCNGYKYLWSKEIQDLTEYASVTHSLIDFDGISHKWFTAWGWEEDENRDLMERDIKTKYNNKNLPKASWASCEVMLYCPNGYYMLGKGAWETYYEEILGEYR